MLRTKKEYMRDYIVENIPKSPYKKIFIRERKPFELFWQEVLVALFIIFMMFMLFINYQSTLNYVPRDTTANEKEVNVGVNIDSDGNLASVFSYNSYSITEKSIF